jgi:hypothetical protein
MGLFEKMFVQNSQASDTFKPLLTEWLAKVSENQKVNHRAAVRFMRYHYILGIPAVILSSIIGTSIFATIEKQTNTTFKVLLGVLSILVAVITGLQTFLRYPERAAKHKEISAKLAEIHREIEQLLANPTAKLNEYRKSVADIGKRLSIISIEAPVIDIEEKYYIYNLESTDPDTFQA